MEIGLYDIFLISPELALLVLGIAIVLADLVIRQQKTMLFPISIVGLLIPLIMTGLLWNEVHTSPLGAISAFHGTLIVDKLALFLKFLILGALILLLLPSIAYTSKFPRYRGEFIGLVFLSATGLMLLSGSADLITIFISLELASLPLVALVAFLKTEIQSIEAGIKYFLLSAISSAVLLYGFAFIYGSTGTTRLLSMDSSVPAISSMVSVLNPTLPFGSYALLIGTIMSVAGFGFKLSIVPFQMWTPDVYEGAPTPITAFLAVASKAAGFAVILRIFHTGLAPLNSDWVILFAGLAAVTMTAGNLMAIQQHNIKRLFGYSAIAHAGYLLIGVAVIGLPIASSGQLNGPSGLLFYLVAYGATTLAAFFTVIAIGNRTGSNQISDLRGMNQRSRWLAGVLSLSLISLTGIPLTAGFMGKLFLFNAAVEANLIWLAACGVINSAVSAYYYLRIVRIIYLGQPQSQTPIGADFGTNVAIAITATLIFLLGIFPSPLLDVAQSAALALAL